MALVVSCLGGASAHAEDIAAYRSAISTALAAAESAKAATGANRERALNDARAAIARVNVVELPGGSTIRLNHAAIVAGLAADGDLDKAIADLRSRLSALSGADRESVVDAEKARNTLNAVLARPEYRERDASFWRQISSWVIREIVAPFLNWLTNSSGGTAVPPVVFAGLAVGLIVVAAVYFGTRGAWTPRAAVEQLVVARGVSRSITEQRLAEAEAARGNYRQALHHLYLALLFELDDTGRLRYDPTLTNRELVSASGAGSDLVDLVIRYDATWYGSASVDAADFGRFRDAIERLRPSRQGVGRAA